MMADEGKFTKEYVPFLSMAKYYATEVAVKVSGEALQMLGAAGYMKDHLTELYYRDARQLTIVEGTSQVQLGLIARGVLDHDCGGTEGGRDERDPHADPGPARRAAPSSSSDEIDAALGEILEGRVADVQAAGFIVALRTKGETVEELAALVRAMHRFATHGRGRPTARSTRAAPAATGRARSTCRRWPRSIAAGAGARVVKHGNRAASSQCGSADVLEALGVAIELGPAGVARCVDEAGVGFCFAPRYHPAMRFLGPARKELGVPTTFNFLGPLANPARVRRQAVGVSRRGDGERMLGTLARCSAPSGRWCSHGDDGLDELTTTTTSTVHELVDGDARTSSQIDPLDLGIARADADAARAAATRRRTPAVVRAVLAGEQGPHRDIAVLNAAAALDGRRASAADLARRRRAGDASDRQRRRGACARSAGARQPGRARAAEQESA